MWIYGICDRPQLAPPRLPGLEDAPLEALSEGGLVAVFTRHAGNVNAPVPDALWAHERVVESLMDERTVVPMRFGSTVAGEDALRCLLAERRDSIAAALGRLRDRVELSVRVLEEAPAATVHASRSGREYLVARLQDSQRTDLAAATLHEPLSVLSCAAVRQSPRSPGELLRSAYLVDRAGVPEFCARVQDLQDAHREMAILCTGPWPAYSFVG